MFTKQIYIHPRKNILWGDGPGEGGDIREKIDVKSKLAGLRNEVENTKLQKEAQAFQDKYPIDKFKEKVFSDVVKHPFISKTWIFFNDFKEIKKNVERFGANLPPAYSAVLKTAENIMGSKEFGKNTGNIEVFIRSKFGEGKTIMEFQENMKVFLDLAANKGTPLSMEDFSRYFNEKRELTLEEIQQAKRYIDTIRKYLDKEKTKEGKLKIIDDAIKNPGVKGPQRLVLQIQNLLTSERSDILRSRDDTSTLSNIAELGRSMWGSGRTDENYKKAQEEKRRLDQDGEVRIIHFDEKSNKFILLTTKDITSELLKPDLGGLNREVFQSLLKSPNWQSYFYKNIEASGIAAVGLYLEKRPNTLLFQGVEYARTFFIEQYRKTLEYQQTLLNEAGNKLHGDFNILFPSLKNNPKITHEIQELIKSKKLAEVYNRLALSGATNGDIKQIMDSIEKNAKSLKEKGLIEISKQEIQFKGKRWSEFKNDFDLKNEDDRKEFEKLYSQQILPVSPEKRAFLLRIVKKETAIGIYIISLSNTINAADAQGQSHIGGKEAGRHPRMAKATPLTPRGTEVMKVAGQAVGATTELQIQTQQTEKYIDGMRELRTDDDKLRKLSELQSIKPSDLSPKQRDLLIALQNWYSVYTKTASNVDSLKQYTSREEAASFVRETFGLQLSKEESLRYVDSQAYIAKYVAEKNFVDTLEKNAAYMNTGDTKTLQELYNQKGQLDVSRMTENTGNVSLGETNLMTNNTFSGMSELMQCQVSMGTDGNYLTRDILDKSGNIVAKDIPLKNLDTTISQLGRFYAIGLGILAPRMNEINKAISSVRPDAIGGTDGTYSLSEDEKFLEIMARLLYTDEDIPKEKNIPNLIRVFHSADPDKSPLKKLWEGGLINNSKEIQVPKLQEKLKEASTQIH